MSALRRLSSASRSRSPSCAARSASRSTAVASAGSSAIKRLEGRSLGGAVATPCGHPGAQLEHPGLRKSLAGQMGRRAHDLVGPAGGLSPVEPGAPDRAVVGPSPLAPRQPVAGLLETPGAGRQVGQAKPDAVVVGGRLLGLAERPCKPVNRIRIVVVVPEDAEGLGGITRPFDIPLQEALPFIALAGDPVHPSQPPPRLLTGAASRAAGAFETRFRESVATGLQSEPAPCQGRELSLFRLIRNTAPGRERGFGMALDQLTRTEPILDLAPRGPTTGEPGKPRPGLLEPPRLECTVRLAQLALELPLPGPPKPRRTPPLQAPGRPPGSREHVAWFSRR